jgi:hypothetical protein
MNLPLIYVPQRSRIATAIIIAIIALLYAYSQRELFA